ncbi:transposase, partial [Leuconostoc suionicum]|nr:transposase [Leuconostoc suionicum]
QQTDGPKVSEYMTLKLMRELGIKSRMQKRYRKPKTVVTVDQKPNLLTLSRLIRQNFIIQSTIFLN